MKKLILTITLIYYCDNNYTLAQINLIEQYESGFISDMYDSKTFEKLPNDLNNNIGTDMNLDNERILDDLIRTAREFENLKNKKLQNIQGNQEIIETLKYALETIQALVCAKISRGELSLSNVHELNKNCGNF
tara:strand:- start:96 stop:494 length:399 start_codon:yes stop_codon:yes gene_type:complete